MRLLTTILRCGLVLGLLAGSLGACQRASYQLQPVAITALQTVTPELGAESAVITIAAAPPATALAQSHRRRLHPFRRSARPRSGRVQAPRLFTRSGVAAGAAAPAPQRQEPGPGAQPVRHRSRGIAIGLAILAVTYLPLSLHNFYLGYYGRGAAAIALVIAGTYLVVLAFLGSIFSGAALVGWGAIGLVMLGGWFLWQLSDLIRIITNDLKPKNGSYNARFFQLKSDAGGTVSPPRTD